MKKTILFLPLLWAFVLHAQPRSYTVANAHSHNDYEQPTPFWAAYNEGFGSIEADIFLHHDSLLVAHDSSELALHRSLEQLYLEPLAACISRNNGQVYADKARKLQLLVDIKTDSIQTLKKLVETLQKFSSLISTPSLQIVISGKRPKQNAFASYPPFIAFDGVLSQAYSPAARKRIALLSDNIANYVRHKAITKREWQRLKTIVRKAHAAKKPVRFWGTPDDKETWKKLIALKVDYINTDQINALANFLRAGANTDVH